MLGEFYSPPPPSPPRDARLIIISFFCQSVKKNTSSLITENKMCTYEQGKKSGKRMLQSI